MIQVYAQYPILAGDFAIFDRATDALMDALAESTEIIAPDVALSMTDHLLEVWMTVPTDDAAGAVRVAAAQLEGAFKRADVSTIRAHPRRPGATVRTRRARRRLTRRWRKRLGYRHWDWFSDPLVVAAVEREAFRPTAPDRSGCPWCDGVAA